MALSELDIIQKARDITGNAKERSGEQHVPDESIKQELKPTIRTLNRLFGSSTGLKETIFDAIANQQDYEIVTYVGTDVQSIESVIRSGAFLSPRLMIGGLTAESTVIPSGYQQDAMDSIQMMAQANHADQYSWEQIQGNLRLYPYPTELEQICVRYVSTGAAIDTLPDETENIMVYAAIVAILDGVLLRMGSSRVTTQNFGETERNRIVAIRDQRDVYKRKMSDELVSLRS